MENHFLRSFGWKEFVVESFFRSNFFLLQNHFLRNSLEKKLGQNFFVAKSFPRKHFGWKNFFLYMCVHLCMCVYVYVCMYVFMRVCVYVQAYMKFMCVYKCFFSKNVLGEIFFIWKVLFAWIFFVSNYVLVEILFLVAFFSPTFFDR